MVLELRQNLKLTQQLLMTPQLQQAIKLLQLSRIELEMFVSQQLAENPILEENQVDFVDEKAESQVEKTSEDFMADRMNEANKIVDKVDEAGSSEVDWESLSRLKESGQSSKSSLKDENQVNYENMLSQNESLSEFLMNQIGELDFTDEEKAVAALIVGNISEKGYFDSDLAQLCKDEQLEYDMADGILDTIQRLNPVGVGARDLKECLLIQLRERSLKNGIVEKIVAENMKELETRNYQAIAKAQGISLDEVYKQVVIIADLEPVPARDFGGLPTQVVIPDVYVFKLSGKWTVSLNEDGLPKVRINEYYKDLASQKGSEDDKEYIHEKVKSANWLIKSIQQRQRTIFKVTESIVERQIDFFDKGVEHLKPMVLKDIAEDVSMHESTISRVTNHKYVHTPRGIFELKYFFNSSVSSAVGDDLSSESVKVMIKAAIGGEDPKKPLSDQKIVAILEEKGVKLARRTVAKYREQLGILPSSKRKKYF